MDNRFPAMAGIGMVWYRREDFPRVLQIMVDRHKLHGTFDEWEQAAKQGEAQLTASGRIIIRAVLDPNQFVAWCAERDLETNASARNQWSADYAYRELSGKS